jgi:hypothetical protein
VTATAVALPPWWLLLIILALFSILMVLALVPLTLELIEPSQDTAAHRRRLRSMGPLGALSAWAVPDSLETSGLLRFWLFVYGLTWAGIAGSMAWLITGSEKEQMARNLALLGLIAGGWFTLQAFIIWFARTLARANRAPGQAETPEEPPPAPEKPVSRKRRTSSGWPGLLLFLGVVLGLRILSDHLPWLKAFEETVARRRGVLLPATIAFTVAGFAAFMAGLFLLVVDKGRPMSHREVEELSARTRLQSMGGFSGGWARYRIRGETAGREAEDEWSLAAMKRAFKSGAFLRERLWRRRFMTFAGAMTMGLGIFAMVFVTGPGWAMLLTGGAVLYALARTTWAFWRA